MTTTTIASKEAPAKEPLYNACELFKGPDFALLVDRLDLDYPDASPQDLVEGLAESQGDPDAVEAVIADIREASEALSWVACKAETLAIASNLLTSHLEELEEEDKHFLNVQQFGALIKREEVVSWFELKGTGLLQEGE